MPLSETASRPEHRIRDAVSACGFVKKSCSTLSAHSGVQFPPETPPGKHIPVWSRNLGCSFRLKGDPESTSHSRGNSGSQFPQIQGDSPPPLSHAFKYAIQKHKTADRMLFFKKVHVPKLTQSSYLATVHGRRLPPTDSDVKMSPKTGHLPAWLDFGQLLVS